MTMRPMMPLLVLLGLVLAACGNDRMHPGELERSDPQGARACHTLQQWLREDHTAADRFALSQEVVKDAGGAKTDSIRSTVNGVADFPRSGGPDAGFDGVALADLRRLHAACEAAGVDMPPYHE
jgi:hypothetical protein